MSALHKLYMACTTVLLGMEVIVLDAVPSPVHDDLQTAELLTVGALSLGVGVAFALGTAFSAGQSGPGAHRSDGRPAPNGIPPWEGNADAEVEMHEGMRVRPRTAAPEPVRPEEALSPTERRDVRLADVWRRWDATGEQAAVFSDTQIMTLGALAEDDETFPTMIDAVQAYDIAPSRVVRADAAALPPSQGTYVDITEHLQAVAAQLAAPAAWDTWPWERAA